MEKQIYKYVITNGEINALELCKTEYPKIKEFWDSEDKGDYPFADITNGLIDELKKISKSKDEILAATRGWNIINELSKIHFTKKLTLDLLLNFCSTGERILMLSKFSDKLSDKEYWEQLGHSYTMQDFSSVPYSVLQSMFTANKGDKKYLMDREEQDLFETLPEIVTVYRGMSTKEDESGNYRMSWTLDKKIAEKFAKRNKMIYKKDMLVKELVIPKKNIIAVFLGRSEKEIIYIQ